MLAVFAAMMAAAEVRAMPCRPDHIGLSLDGRAGDFNGMSHAGVLVSFRNRGPACRIENLPRIAFVDERGRTLPITRNRPIAIHSGPAKRSLIIPAGGIASAPLRWVSAEVYDRSRCFSPQRMRATIFGRSIFVRFTGRICGAADKAAGFDQPPLRFDRDAAGGREMQSDRG